MAVGFPIHSVVLVCEPGLGVVTQVLPKGSRSPYDGLCSAFESVAAKFIHQPLQYSFAPLSIVASWFHHYICNTYVFFHSIPSQYDPNHPKSQAVQNLEPTSSNFGARKLRDNVHISPASEQMTIAMVSETQSEAQLRTPQRWN